MKYTGIFLTIIIVSFIILINLFFAHYRDALLDLTYDPDMYINNMRLVAANARNTLLEAPLNLNDIKSYLLFIVGSGLAFFTAHKAYETDDPYPGYGKIQREQDKYKGFPCFNALEF